MLGVHDAVPPFVSVTSSEKPVISVNADDAVQFTRIVVTLPLVDTVIERIICIVEC